MLLKTAANALKLREIALKYGLIPEVGRKWKSIARKLVKVTSDNYPRNGKTTTELADKVFPARQHYHAISRLDNVVGDKYLRREFAGFVKGDKASLTNIGNRFSVAASQSPTLEAYHKHPFATVIPSKEDLGATDFFSKYFAEDVYKPGNRVINIKGNVYNGDHDLAGLTGYSSKYQSFKGKPGRYLKKGDIDYVYKKNPHLYNLSGRLKNIEIGTPERTYKTLHDAEKKYLSNKGIKISFNDDRKTIQNRAKLRQISAHLRDEPSPLERIYARKRMDEIVEKRKDSLRSIRKVRQFKK